jgi:hypothetical protein
MRKYEVIFNVISSGFHENDAAERAGAVFNGTNMDAGIVLNHMGTRKLRDRALIFETIVNVCVFSVNENEAAEKAGLLVDPQMMEPAMKISLAGVRSVRGASARDTRKVVHKNLNSAYRQRMPRKARSA